MAVTNIIVCAILPVCVRCTKRGYRIAGIFHGGEFSCKCITELIRASNFCTCNFHEFAPLQKSKN